MNGAYLHLLVNHIPIFTILFGGGILVFGTFKKATQIRKLGTVLLIIGALMSYVALESGEWAEEQIEESFNSVTHDRIHEHEEAAEVAFWFSFVTGGLAIISLFSTKMNTRFQQILSGVVIVTAVFTFFSLIYTAYEGGKIRHSQEISQSSELFEPDIDF